MSPLNDENEICNKCRKPTVPIFHTGRKRWCPDCEKDDKEHPPIGSKFDRDETTIKRSDDDDPYGWNMYDPKKKVHI